MDRTAVLGSERKEDMISDDIFTIIIVAAVIFGVGARLTIVTMYPEHRTAWHWRPS